jgi:hypothetical protein
MQLQKVVNSHDAENLSPLFMILYAPKSDEARLFLRRNVGDRACKQKSKLVFPIELQYSGHMNRIDLLKTLQKLAEHSHVA